MNNPDAVPPYGTSYLSDLSPSDKPWDGHRRDSELVSLNFRTGGLERYGERVNNCSTRLMFAQEAVDSGEIGLKLYAAQFCRVRLCPVCQWRKQLMWRARFFQCLPKYLAAHPNYVPLLLTLTVRNCELTELNDTIKHLHESFKRLIQRKMWPARGFVRSLEVTRNRETNQAHPHLHVLMFVRKTYFSGKHYISHQTWVDTWQQCLRVDYPPNVDIRRVKATTEEDTVWDKLTEPKTGSKSQASAVSEMSADSGAAPIFDTYMLKAICETLKYSVKPSELVDNSDWLIELAKQLHNVRAVAVGGDLREFLNEEEPEDLIHSGDREIPDIGEYRPLMFDWATEVKRYALSRLHEKPM